MTDDILYRVFRDDVPSATFASYPKACEYARVQAANDASAPYTVNTKKPTVTA